MDDLKARLRAHIQGVPHLGLYNPDGPEAAARIETLEAENAAKDAEIATLQARLTQMEEALRRVQRNFDLLLAGRPVRDVAETRAETDAALSQANQEKR